MNFSGINPKITTSVDLSLLRLFESVQMDDEPDLIVELIDLYLEDVPRRFEVMRSAFAGNDYSNIKRQAHTLKGSSNNLGALELARICDQIELLEINAPTSGLLLLMAQVEQEFSRVRVIFLEERERRLA